MRGVTATSAIISHFFFGTTLGTTFGIGGGNITGGGGIIDEGRGESEAVAGLTTTGGNAPTICDPEMDGGSVIATEGNGGKAGNGGGTPISAALAASAGLATIFSFRRGNPDASSPTLSEAAGATAEMSPTGNVSSTAFVPSASADSFGFRRNRTGLSDAAGATTGVLTTPPSVPVPLIAGGTTSGAAGLAATAGSSSRLRGRKRS